MTEKVGPLLIIDQKPILKKALTECRRLRTELHKKQARLREFEETERPAYDRWISAHFGAELTAVRELQEERAKYEFIFEQISCCELWMPHKLADVYAELMERLENGTLYAFEPPQPEGSEDEEFDDADEENEDEEDPMKKFFDELFEEFIEGSAADEDEFGHESEFEGDPELMPRKQKQNHELNALKALYRTLAKRLHPDRADMEERMRERRWNELQAAYQSADLSALQRIEAICDMDEGGLSIHLGLARLRDLAAYHRSHLRPIRQVLKEAKRHPAFNFAEADEAWVKREVYMDLKQTHDQILRRVQWLKTEAREMAQDLVG